MLPQSLSLIHQSCLDGPCTFVYGIVLPCSMHSSLHLSAPHVCAQHRKHDSTSLTGTACTVVSRSHPLSSIVQYWWTHHIKWRGGNGLATWDYLYSECYRHDTSCQVQVANLCISTPLQEVAKDSPTDAALSTTHVTNAHLANAWVIELSLKLVLFSRSLFTLSYVAKSAVTIQHRSIVWYVGPHVYSTKKGV